MGGKFSLNWTSCCRNDDAIVPTIEKYKAKRFHDIQSIEELKAFGETLDTGDIIIAHCTHNFGKMTQLGTLSVWDHVAMIVRLPMEDEEVLKARKALIKKSPQPESSTVTWPKQPGENEPVKIFEAMGGGSFTYPFTAHTIARGKFFKYTAVRRLRNAKGEPLDDNARKKIEAFVQEYWARPYEEGTSGMKELLRPIFHRKPNIRKKRDKSKEALDNVFCSELIVEALQAAGILPEDTLNSNEILPSMFAPDKTVDSYLEIQKHGYKFGEVEIFKAPETTLHERIRDLRTELKSKRREKIKEDAKDFLKRKSLTGKINTADAPKVESLDSEYSS